MPGHSNLEEQLNESGPPLSSACINCRFYYPMLPQNDASPESTGGTGRCKRYPPVTYGDGDRRMMVTAQPIVTIADTCGEFSFK